MFVCNVQFQTPMQFTQKGAEEKPPAPFYVYAIE